MYYDVIPHPTSGNILTQYRRPRVQHGTLGQHFRAFPSPGSTAADPFVSRTRLFTHETTSADPPVSKTRRSAHETTSEDPHVSRMRLFAHETSLADSFVSRTRRFAHETTLADSFVSRTRRSAHENDSEDPPVSRMRRLTHETTSELSCATGTLRELYGDSTGAPRCRRGETRASATHRETWCLSGR